MKKTIGHKKEYEAEIEDIIRTSGEIKIADFIIFVSNTKQGEYVKSKITRVGSKLMIGELGKPNLIGFPN